MGIIWIFINSNNTSLCLWLFLEIYVISNYFRKSNLSSLTFYLDSKRKLSFWYKKQSVIVIKLYYYLEIKIFTNFKFKFQRDLKYWFSELRFFKFISIYWFIFIFWLLILLCLFNKLIGGKDIKILIKLINWWI